MRFDKSKIPPDVPYDKYFAQAYAGIPFEDWFEEKWAELCEAIPHYKDDAHMKGYYRYLEDFRVRYEYLDKLIESAPKESYHTFYGDWRGMDDIHVEFTCECGHEMTFGEFGVKKLCLECGRIYKLESHTTQSDYLLEAE